MISYNTTNYRLETKSNTVVDSVVSACSVKTNALLLFFKKKNSHIQLMFQRTLLTSNVCEIK